MAMVLTGSVRIVTGVLGGILSDTSGPLYPA